MYNYYAPFQRQIGYYNPSIPQEAQAYQQGYQPYQQPVQVPNQPNMALSQPSNTSDMIWVLNETEATSYPVAPNNSVTLWDKNKDTIYIKSVNMQGVPSMRILDYTDRTVENGSKIAENERKDFGGKFIREEDFRALEAKFDGLQNELNELKAKKVRTAKVVKMEEIDDE